MKGYLNLTSYTLFFLLFVFLIMAQVDVPNIAKIDNMVRHVLLDQDGALASIQDHVLQSSCLLFFFPAPIHTFSNNSSCDAFSLGQGGFFDYLLKDYNSKLGAFEGEDTGGILGKLFQLEW